MNKKLRLLLLTGLTAVFFASCNKVEELFPEPFNHNGKPFSVEKVPVEGGTIKLNKVTHGVESPLNYELTTLSFQAGDSLILTATPKNGYTFINWVRDGKPISTQPKYEFCLDGNDIIDGRVKYHYEARFGNDYAIQSIPSIDAVMPADLIAEMGPYLHFGDNPPHIDSFYVDVLEIKHFIHNSDHPEIPFDTNTMYYLKDGQDIPTRIQFDFYGQHRGIFDSCRFERAYGEMFNDGTASYYLFEKASAQDSIFIMGSGNDFTLYFRHSMRRSIEPYNEFLANNITGGLSLVRIESVIISGTLSGQRVNDFHWGYRIEQYSESLPIIGRRNGLPAIHDLFHIIEHQP